MLFQVPCKTHTGLSSTRLRFRVNAGEFVEARSPASSESTPAKPIWARVVSLVLGSRSGAARRSKIGLSAQAGEDAGLHDFLEIPQGNTVADLKRSGSSSLPAPATVSSR